MGMSQLFAVEQSERTSDDYLTPRWVFETLDIAFDLDVAAPPWGTHVPATRKFTQADDGLTQPWEGRVWMNPPYSHGGKWVARFMEHRNGVALLPFSRSQWQLDLWDAADGIAQTPTLFVFAGGEHIFMPVFFAAFGDECVEAIGRLGRVR
jgi:hypothetical protein